MYVHVIYAMLFVKHFTYIHSVRKQHSCSLCDDCLFKQAFTSILKAKVKMTIATHLVTPQENTCDPCKTIKISHLLDMMSQNGPFF